MVAHAYYPSTWEVEAKGWGVQGHPQIHSKFETSLRFVSKTSKSQKEVGEGGRKEGGRVHALGHYGYVY